eukprot:TRINITY_DN4829_c0_g1_i1.p1 TRINITY_DN4829_c0_g1~~TRINITY_DN4829_c0_g1_i1.p1  ORF type:complete len:202 (+),score=8.81 TRINITY_DN4829_c0_g1_i1:33-638(+)
MNQTSLRRLQIITNQLVPVGSASDSAQGLERLETHCKCEAKQTYYECPQEYECNEHQLSLFLGGGVTGCPNWQGEVTEKLKVKCPRLILLNPKRANFDVNDTSLHDQQIDWEFRHLRLASAVMFWFPCETLCPITLYELGTWSILSQQTGAKLFVGCHPEYKRKADVETQTKLVRPDVCVVSSIDDIVQQIADWYNNLNEH